MDHLIIPDPHSHPDFHNKRFDWLGRLMLDLKPDKVVCMGDMADLPSLCSYDKGTKGFEGRRYKKDIEAVIDAQRRLFAPLKKAKKRKPEMHMLEGNHEHRITRAINSDPARLDGIISLSDLRYKSFGWTVTPYKGSTPGVVVLDGIAYAHYFTSGIMGRPISGLHPAYQQLAKQYMSCTGAHSHIVDYAIRTNADGKFIHGLMAGTMCDYFAEFAGEANSLWWRDVIHKRNVVDGQYDPEFISLAQLKKEYG